MSNLLDGHLFKLPKPGPVYFSPPELGTVYSTAAVMSTDFNNTNEDKKNLIVRWRTLQFIFANRFSIVCDGLCVYVIIFHVSVVRNVFTCACIAFVLQYQR